MSENQQLQQITTEDILLTVWHKQRPDYTTFVQDGIVCPEVFNKQRRRILFVLKETDKLDGDLRDFLQRDNSYSWKTWDNVSRWTQALLEGGEFWGNENHNANRHSQLNKIAAINLKKTSGRADTDAQELESFAERDRVFIQRQLELIAPTIIVCCGRKDKSVASILHDNVLKSDSPWLKIANTRYNYFIYNDNVPVISFVHPNLRNQNLCRPRFEDMLEIANFLNTEFK